MLNFINAFSLLRCLYDHYSSVGSSSVVTGLFIVLTKVLIPLDRTPGKQSLFKTLLLMGDSIISGFNLGCYYLHFVCLLGSTTCRSRTFNLCQGLWMQRYCGDVECKAEKNNLES